MSDYTEALDAKLATNLLYNVARTTVARIEVLALIAPERASVIQTVLDAAEETVRQANELDTVAYERLSEIVKAHAQEAHR